MKQCTKCKQGKELDEFSNCKRGKDRKKSQCKECMIQYNKQGYQNNKEYRIQSQKRYNEDNKEYRKQYNKQGYENNIEYRRQLRNSPIIYNEDTNRRGEIESYEDIGESENGNLMCLCASCNEGFEPTRLQIENRLGVMSGRVGSGRSECRLYCSDECKEACSVYQQQKYPKGQKPYVNNRETQKEVRDLRIEVDNYTCQNCKTHQNDLEESLECHHIGPINESPHTSADVDECKMVCKECHKEIHKKPGCTYEEMKCQVE